MGGSCTCGGVDIGIGTMHEPGCALNAAPGVRRWRVKYEGVLEVEAERHDQAWELVSAKIKGLNPEPVDVVEIEQLTGDKPPALVATLQTVGRDLEIVYLDSEDNRFPGFWRLAGPGLDWWTNGHVVVLLRQDPLPPLRASDNDRCLLIGGRQNPALHEILGRLSPETGWGVERAQVADRYRPFLDLGPRHLVRGRGFADAVEVLDAGGQLLAVVGCQKPTGQPGVEWRA